MTGGTFNLGGGGSYAAVYGTLSHLIQNDGTVLFD